MLRAIKPIIARLALARPVSTHPLVVSPNSLRCKYPPVGFTSPEGGSADSALSSCGTHPLEPPSCMSKTYAGQQGYDIVSSKACTLRPQFQLNACTLSRHPRLSFYECSTQSASFDLNVGAVTGADIQGVGKALGWDVHCREAHASDPIFTIITPSFTLC